jgi:hypothetical protein
LQFGGECSICCLSPSRRPFSGFAANMATVLLFLSANAVSGEVASVNSGRSAYASWATMVSPPHQVSIRRAKRRG